MGRTSIRYFDAPSVLYVPWFDGPAVIRSFKSVQERGAMSTGEGEISKNVTKFRTAIADAYEAIREAEELHQAAMDIRRSERRELVDRFNGLRDAVPGLPKFETSELEKRGYAYLMVHVDDMIMSCPDQSSIDGMRAFMALAAKIFAAE